MSKLEWMILIVILDLALIFCIITLAVLANAANAATVQFVWEHDGNCDGFILYMSETPAVYTAAKIVYIPNSDVRTCKVIYPKLTGIKYWTMRAYDNLKRISDKSNEVTADLTSKPNLTPADLVCVEGGN
jgi:hypothetical protein